MSKSQVEAIEELTKALGGRYPVSADSCTGDIETCPNDECLVCGTRDCPSGEPLHYHHDGCPSCNAGLWK